MIFRSNHCLRAPTQVTLSFFAGVVLLLLALPAHAKKPATPQDSVRVRPDVIAPPMKLPAITPDPRVLIGPPSGQGAPGLLQGPEYRSLEKQLATHGSRIYGYRTLDQPSDREAMRGLLLLRESRHLRQIGKSFFDDGRGNLVHFGTFERQQALPVSYSLTLFLDGGGLLAMDETGDGVVDAVVSRRLDRFGVLATEDFQQFADCFERARRSGADPLKAAADCFQVPGRGGAGSGHRFSDFVENLLDPDCGNVGPKGPDFGWISDPGVNPERVRNARDESLRQAHHYRGQAREAWAKGDRALAEANDRVADDYVDLAIAAQRVLNTERGSAERGQAYADANDALERLDEDMDHLLRLERTRDLISEIYEARRRAREEGEREGQHPGGTEPRPDELPGGKDPRCQPKPDWAEWSRRCQENLRDCLTQKDPLSVMTGGQCVVRTGPDDEPGPHCDGNDSMAQCLAAGGSVSGCAEETYRHCSNVGPDGRRPEGCEGYAPTDRPSPARGVRTDIEFLQVSELGGVIAAICREAGGTGLCGDRGPMLR